MNRHHTYPRIGAVVLLSAATVAGATSCTTDDPSTTPETTAATSTAGGSGGMGASDSGGMGGAGGAPQDECATQGDTQCVDGLVASCDDTGDGQLVWGTPEACAGENMICRGDSCESITMKQLAQAEVLAAYTKDLRDYTGYDGPIDYEQLEDDARLLLFLGDESDKAFAKAVYHVFKGVPQGHSAIGFGPLDYSACFDPAGPASLSGGNWYGVCGRSAGDASIVTFAATDNPMGLAPGDRIVRIEKDGEVWESPGFLDRIGQEAVCDSGIPSDSARADYAATNLFGILDEGDTVDVLDPSGATRQVTVPARGGRIGCRDPLRRPERTSFFSTSQRPDGVVVVILPTFGDHPDHPFPNPLTFQSYRDWNAQAIERINTDLAQYTNVTGRVWDIRGNSGGAQEYALGVVGALGASEGATGTCHARIPESDPPMFETAAEYPLPYQVFVDQPLPTINFSGAQAIVTDGLAVSAADWMTYFASQNDIVVVGHASAGSYGYQTGASFVARNIEPEPGVHGGVSSYISGARCVDTASGQAMEGVAPIDITVDFSPADLAAGVDTQLEAAVAAVLN